MQQQLWKTSRNEKEFFYVGQFVKLGICVAMTEKETRTSLHGWDHYVVHDIIPEKRLCSLMTSLKEKTALLESGNLCQM